VVVARKNVVGSITSNVHMYGTGALNIDGCRVPVADADESGRWPTNVCLDESQAAELDRQSGVLASGKVKAGHAGNGKQEGIFGAMAGVRSDRGFGDAGGASRFFPVFRYEAKASSEERPRVDGIAHPTVKPLELMRWLCRLVTPPGGVVLDPFAGSGSTVEAAVLEHFRPIGIERDPGYLPLIRHRLGKPLQQVLDLGELP
jgi:site-specific DNA-methyltransferase (adenine-specific)